MGPYDSAYITDSQGHSGAALSSSGTHLHSRLAAGMSLASRYTAAAVYSRAYSFFVLYTGIQPSGDGGSLLGRPPPFEPQVYGENIAADGAGREINGVLVATTVGRDATDEWTSVTTRHE